MELSLQENIVFQLIKDGSHSTKDIATLNMLSENQWKDILEKNIKEVNLRGYV